MGCAQSVVARIEAKEITDAENDPKLIAAETQRLDARNAQQKSASATSAAVTSIAAPASLTTKSLIPYVPTETTKTHPLSRLSAFILAICVDDSPIGGVGLHLGDAEARHV